ncbi:ETC complex I subunit conserved region-domain-containing protein [Massariosphaeria phaeospora]|uniref:ETC complex I subunit conserved region-domain-containing protein n=1 Tax=Massariosphaeria phaeospora TaxID=100035 RepID=A0A7C8IPY3_9PLEO|nr:ETC complex I subunit conserved region-domain-containing protein [Massariosphaeria phaeospora]
MRAATRLLASVKPGQYLEIGSPTGLTGLRTHPTPRSTLLYLYNSTLDKLKQIPESSVYRQSTEALTRHRMKIIEEVKPEGWDAWMEKVQMQVADNPDAFKIKKTSGGVSVVPPRYQSIDARKKAAEWDGEKHGSFPEGIRSQRERRPIVKAMRGNEDYTPEKVFSEVKVDPEPQLTADVISDLESRIGAGLIEEVIQVAEGEHKLVDEMIKSKVWEPLEEPSPEGQWSYFERGTHTSTQHP